MQTPCKEKGAREWKTVGERWEPNKEKKEIQNRPNPRQRRNRPRPRFPRGTFSLLTNPVSSCFRTRPQHGFHVRSNIGTRSTQWVTLRQSCYWLSVWNSRHNKHRVVTLSEGHFQFRIFQICMEIWDLLNYWKEYGPVHVVTGHTIVLFSSLYLLQCLHYTEIFEFTNKILKSYNQC